MPGSCARRWRQCIPSKIMSARSWRFGCPTSYWTGARRRFGLTRFNGVAPGCCAGRTRPAFVSGSGWGCGSGSCRWSASSMMWDTGQGRPCERRTRGDGWTERSPSSFLWKEAGLHDDVPDHDPRVGKAFMELPRLGGHLAIVRRRRPDGRKTSPCVPEPRRRMVCASPWCGRVAHPGSWLASPGARRRRSATGSVRPTGMKGVTRAV